MEKQIFLKVELTVYVKDEEGNVGKATTELKVPPHVEFCSKRTKKCVEHAQKMIDNFKTSKVDGSMSILEGIILKRVVGNRNAKYITPTDIYHQMSDQERKVFTLEQVRKAFSNMIGTKMQIMADFDGGDDFIEWIYFP